MWHEMDPRIASILGVSLSNYRHELLLPNLAGIPILQQHGSADDNVPVFHSRRLSQLISQTNGSSKYIELQGKGHWFDGVMTSEPLQEFYENVLEKKSVKAHLPLDFEFIVTSSGDLGSKGGIRVDQLISPDRLGHIKVSRHEDGSTWALTTSNILRFHFSTLESAHVWPTRIVIDSQSPLLVTNRNEQRSQYFLRGANNSWAVRMITPLTSSANRFRRLLTTTGSRLGKGVALSSVRLMLSFGPKAVSLSRPLISRVSRSPCNYLVVFFSISALMLRFQRPYQPVFLQKATSSTCQWAFQHYSICPFPFLSRFNLKTESLSKTPKAEPRLTHSKLVWVPSFSCLFQTRSCRWSFGVLIRLGWIELLDSYLP